VLFAGRVSSGRATSLGHLIGDLPKPGEAYFPPIAADCEVRTSAGEPIQLHARVPYFGNLGYDSYQDILDAPHPWMGDAARSLFAFLPTLDGMIFVVRSTLPAGSLRELRALRVELARAGIDLDRFPVVFQHNMRDHACARPLDELMATFSTPRCAHVESVAIVGHGVRRALDLLVELIDHPAVHAPSLPPRRPPAEPWTAAPQRLFEEAASDLTSDGEIRAALRTTTPETGLPLGRAAIALAWPKDPIADLDFAEGLYDVDVTERVVSLRDGQRVGEPRVIAARIRRQDAGVARRELLHEARTMTSFLLVGAPHAVEALTQESLARGAYERESKHHAARHDGVLLLDAGTRNEVHIWLGRDREDQLVEIAVHGDDGHAVLQRGAP
jgi:hypothetical protein